MSTVFKCPSCGGPIDFEALNAPTGTPSLTVRCPYCSNSVVVPEELRAQRSAPQPAAPAAPEPPAPPTPAATSPEAIRAQIRDNRRTAREQRRQLRHKLREARRQK